MKKRALSLALLPVFLAACSSGGSVPQPSASSSTAPVTQALASGSGGTASLPSSGGISGASVTFPPSSSLPSGVSVTFSSSGGLTPPTALNQTRRALSASALAFWQMTFGGSTQQGVAFSGNVTVTIPTPGGTSGTGLVLEVFDGNTLLSSCASTISGNDTVFACANPVLNLGDTYWIEVISGTSLASSSSCIVPVAAAPSGPHLAYYTDAGNDVVDSFDVCSPPSSGVTATFSLPVGTLQNVADTGEIRFDRGAASGDPRVFVLGANGTLVYLDASTTPGTVLQTLTFSGTPHHFTATDPGVSPEMLYVTVGNTTVQAYTVSQSSPYLTLSKTSTAFSSPRGINVEGFVNGTPNDLIVANFGNGTIAAVNPASLAVDSTVSVGGEPQRVSGPNAGLNCALVANASNDTVSAVSVVAPGGTLAAIGSSIALSSAPTADTFFPPGTPGSGTPGFGGNTGFVAMSGSGQIVTCDGTTFTAGGTLTVPSSPNLNPSNYSSTAVDSLVYVVGTNNGTGIVQGYSPNLTSPVFSVSLPSGVVPQDVTAGP